MRTRVRLIVYIGPGSHELRLRVSSASGTALIEPITIAFSGEMSASEAVSVLDDYAARVQGAITARFLETLLLRDGYASSLVLGASLRETVRPLDAMIPSGIAPDEIHGHRGHHRDWWNRVLAGGSLWSRRWPGRGI